VAYTKLPGRCCKGSETQAVGLGRLGLERIVCFLCGIGGAAFYLQE